MYICTRTHARTRTHIYRVILSDILKYLKKYKKIWKSVLNKSCLVTKGKESDDFG